VATIFSSTSGLGLYFESSCRSLPKPGSLVGYGRYSSTSRAQRAAFGIPASSNACCSSAMDALLALTFAEAAGDAWAAAAGEPAVVAADGDPDAAGELDAATGELDVLATGELAGAVVGFEVVAAGGLVAGAAALPELPAGADDPVQAASSSALVASASGIARNRRRGRERLVAWCMNDGLQVVRATNLARREAEALSGAISTPGP
jgi:hypothetical protein